MGNWLILIYLHLQFTKANFHRMQKSFALNQCFPAQQSRPDDNAKLNSCSQLYKIISSRLQQSCLVLEDQFKSIVEEWKFNRFAAIVQFCSRRGQLQIGKIEQEIIASIDAEDETHISYLHELKSKMIINSNNTQLSNARPINRPKNEILQNTQVKQKEIFKNRSLSTGLGFKRKLSKNSCFAEAKKTTTVSNFTQSSGFRAAKENQNNDKVIKKGRKWEDNLLFKTLHTSHADDGIFDTRRETKIKPNKSDNSNNEQNSWNSYVDARSRQILANTESKTYEKIMTKFEEKISKKIDELMDKYTDIEQKFTLREGLPCQNLQIKEPSQSLTQSSQIPQIKTFEKPFKVIDNLENRAIKQQVKTGNQNDKKIIKSTLKERVMFQQSQSSPIEEVLITKQDLNPKTAEIYKQSDKLQITASAEDKGESNKISAKRLYLEDQILEFYQVTKKLLLPISKKLLTKAVKQYLKYCQANNASPKPAIVAIELEKQEVTDKEHCELLAKMEKAIDLRCEQDKKDKILLYIQRYLTIAVAFSSDSEGMNRPAIKTEAKSLKQKIQELVNDIK